MRAVVQRVKSAQVKVDGQMISKIDSGLLTLLGIAKGDLDTSLVKLIEKICHLRIFEDESGKMNRSIQDVGGSHLIVSQFTLLGDCTKGNRPSFVNAEAPEKAIALYEKAIEFSRSFGVPTFGGQFGAHMEVELVNDGPVTLVFEY